MDSPKGNSVLEAIGLHFDSDDEIPEEERRQQQREDRLRRIALESLYRNRLLKRASIWKILNDQ